MKTTLNKIRDHAPCRDGWEKLLKHLGKTKADDEPLSLLTILESNGLDDALWCLRAVDGCDKEMRLYAVWCARKVQHLMPDQRSLDALDVAEKCAHGQATDEELKQAWDAARAAAWAAETAAARAVSDAACHAACHTAWHAARAARAAARAARAAARAARDAEWVAARGAAWTEARATSYAAWDATGAEQEAEFRRMLEEEFRRMLKEIEGEVK